MERHLSTGVSTIVALMAAHRAASGREGPPAAYSQQESARIYSEPLRGTMVCLYLPRHHDAAMPPEDVETVPAAVSQSMPGITVSVVEDEHAIRALIVEALADQGYASLEAADGAAALTILQSNAPIALLISDIGLPKGMNGRQVADAARVLRPDLKVLFITGYAENAMIHHGHLSHNMHVMMKPFAMEALASRAREIIATPLAPSSRQNS